MTAKRSGGRPAPRGGAGGVRRADRVASEIQRILSGLLLHKMRDPRVAHVTVTRVRVTDDLGLARVFFALLEVGEGDRGEAQRGLESAAPFFRRTVAGELGLRHAPELHFAYDDDLDSARRVDAVLRDLRRQREAAQPHDDDEDGGGTGGPGDAGGPSGDDGG